MTRELNVAVQVQPDAKTYDLVLAALAAAHDVASAAALLRDQAASSIPPTADAYAAVMAALAEAGEWQPLLELLQVGLLPLGRGASYFKSLTCDAGTSSAAWWSRGLEQPAADWCQHWSTDIHHMRMTGGGSVNLSHNVHRPPGVLQLQTLLVGRRFRCARRCCRCRKASQP